MSYQRSIRRFDDLLPSVQTDLNEFETVVALTALLVGGLAFATPLAKALVGLPLIAGVGVTCGIYAVATILIREIERGTYVALIVTATFPANVPLSQDAVFGVVSDMGREVFLVHAPLLVLALSFVRRGWYDVRTMDLSEKLLLGFVGWVVLAGLLGGARRLDAVAFAALFYFLAFLAFSSVRRAVSTGLLAPRSVFASFCMTMLGHVSVAFIQFVRQHGFGFTELGEGSYATVARINLGPLGTLDTGPFVSGFAGWELGTLLLLIVFVVMGYAIETDGPQRYAATITAVLFAVVLRLHGFDADRGGLIVALAVFVFGAVSLGLRPSFSVDTDSLRERFFIVARRRRVPTKTTLWGTVVSGVLGIIAFYPTSVAGKARENAQVGVGTSGGSGTGSSEGAVTILDRIASMSVPFFDLSSLLPRLEQIVTGFEMFLSNPLFGIGAANWEYVPGTAMRLHNAYLAFLVETGLVGLVLYYGAVATALVRSRFLLVTSGEDRLLFLGVVASVVGVSASIFFEPFDKYSMLVPFWILLGVLIGRWSAIDDASARGN